MNKKILVIGWILVSLSTLYSNGQKEITVGFIGNLSGRGSEIWVNARNGLTLAIDQYNSNNPPYHLNLVIGDTQGEPDIARLRMEEMIDQGIDLFFGPTTSGSATNLEDYFLRDDILFLSPTVSSDVFSGRDDSLIRLISTAKQQGHRLAGAAFDREGDSVFVILQDTANNTYTSQVSQGFVDEVESREGLILQIIYYDGSQSVDFESLALQVLDLEPHGLLISGRDLDSASIIQQVFKKNDTIHFYSPAWAQTAEFIMNAGKASEGSYQVGLFDDDSTHPGYLEFRKDYLERYGVVPIFTAARYYEMMDLLGGHLLDLKSWDITVIKAAIIEKEINHSFQGDFSIDKYGDADRPYLLLQIREGKAVLVE